MADDARNELTGTLQRLLKSGDYSDCSITCGDLTFKDVNKVDLFDDAGAAVKLLVQYFYQGEYDPELPDGKYSKDGIVYNYTGRRSYRYDYDFPHTCSEDNGKGLFAGGCPSPYLCPHHMCGNHCNCSCKNFVCKICCPNADTLPPPPGDAAQLLLHAQMYEIGDKYDVTGLQQLAREKFLRACALHWVSEHFAKAAHHAFTTTPDEDKELRDVVSNTISQHMILLKKPAIEALLNEFNGLAVGLLKAHGKTLGWV